MRFILSLMLSLLAGNARAEMKTQQWGYCKLDSLEFSLLKEIGTNDSEGMHVTVISSRISPQTGLNLTTDGILHRADGYVELPFYWRPSRIPLTSCVLSGRAAVAGQLRDVPMYVQVYFIEGDVQPSPDLDLEQLVRDKRAFPFKVNVLCRTDDAVAQLLACREIVILDKIIPIDPPSGISALGVPTAVPIESKICGTEKAIASVGTLLRWNNADYLVTSAGSVLSEQGQNSCTSADWNGQTIPLELVRQDWGMGLALLAWPLPSAGIGPWQIAEPANGTLLGFSDSHAPQKKMMNLLAASSSRHFIPSLARAVEVQGESVTFHWMGAPLVNSEGAIEGIVSHQFLQIHPGSLTRPTRWLAGQVNQTSDHLIVIPAATVLNWMGTPAQPALWVKPESQFSEPSRMKSGHILFTELCPPLDATKPGDGYPIGGGDPTGIGGDGNNYRSCKIQVSLDAGGDGRFFLPQRQKLHDTWESMISLGYALEIPFQFTRGEGDYLRRDYFYSTESFFQALTLPESPLVIARKDQRSGTDASLAEMRNAALLSSEQAKTVYQSFSTSDFQTENLVRQIYFLSKLAESEQYGELRDTDFQEILAPGGPYASSWGFLQYIVGAAGMRKNFEALYSAWRKGRS